MKTLKCHLLGSFSQVLVSFSRTIATKVLGARMLQGYALREVLCTKCEMPLMALMGLERSAQCVVCPVLKKRAARERAEREKAEKIRLQKERIVREATLQRDKEQTRATGSMTVQEPRTSQSQPFLSGLQASTYESAQRSINGLSTQLSYHSSVVEPLDCTQRVEDYTKMSIEGLQEIGSLITSGSTSTENGRTQLIKTELIKKLQEEAAAIRKEADDAMNRAREALEHVENAKREILAISDRSSNSYEEEASSVPQKEESMDNKNNGATNPTDTLPSTDGQKKEAPKAAPSDGDKGGKKDSMVASTASPSVGKDVKMKEAPALDVPIPSSNSNEKKEGHPTPAISSPSTITDNKTKEDPTVPSRSPCGDEDDKMNTAAPEGKNDDKKKDSCDLSIWEQLRLDSKLVRSRRLLTGWKEITDKCRGKECNGALLLYNGRLEECIVCGGSGNGKDGVYGQLKDDNGGRLNSLKEAKSGSKKAHSGDHDKNSTKQADVKLNKKKNASQTRQKRIPGEAPSFRMSPKNRGCRTRDTSSRTARCTMEELETDFSVKRRIVSKEIGKRMLKGWTLLDLACPYCVMPLMVNSKGAKVSCVLCGPIRLPLDESFTQVSQQVSAEKKMIEKSDASVDNRSQMTRSSEKSKTRFVLPDSAEERAIAASRSNDKPASSSPRRSCLRSPSSTHSPKNAKSDMVEKNREKTSTKVSQLEDKKATPETQGEKKDMPRDETRKNIERLRPAPLQLTPAPFSHPGDEVPKTVVLVHGSTTNEEDAKSPHFLISRFRNASRHLKMQKKSDPPPVSKKVHKGNQGIEPDEEIDGILHEPQPVPKPHESDISSISKSEDDEEATKVTERKKGGNEDVNTFTSLADSIEKAKRKRDVNESATPSAKHQNNLEVSESAQKKRMDPDTFKTVDIDDGLEESNGVRTKSHQLDAPESRSEEAFETKILLLEDDDTSSPDKVLTLEVPLDFDVGNKESLQQLLIAAKAPSPSLDVDTTGISARRCHPSPGMEAAPTPLPLTSPDTSSRGAEKSRSSRPRVTPETLQRSRSRHRAIPSRDSDVSTMYDSAVLAEKPNLVKKYAFPRASSTLATPVPTMVRTKRKGKKKKKENEEPESAKEKVRVQNTSEHVVSEIPDPEEKSTPGAVDQVDSQLIEISGDRSVSTTSFYDLLERIHEKTELENEQKGSKERGKSKSRLHEVIQKLSKAAEEMNEKEYSNA